MYLPTEYIQRNTQTDEALKLLNLYPTRIRGEKKSDFYLKIIKISEEICSALKITSMTLLDNILYCLNRGYLGDILSRKKSSLTEDIKKIEQTDEGDQKQKYSHTEIMYYLIQIGKNK